MRKIRGETVRQRKAKDEPQRRVKQRVCVRLELREEKEEMKLEQK